MKVFLLSALLCMGVFATAQEDYHHTIEIHRQQYKQEFLTDPRSPLKSADTGFLRFFPADKRYRVKGNLVLTPAAEPFDMPTASGKTKRYRQYGTLLLNINDTAVQLQVLQSLKMLEDPKYKDHLFLAFTDKTTYSETYGGGRYLDLSLNDIKEGTIEVDFNKCYNPWCAYAGGYSCPIPPVENRVNVAIRAGEMNFGRQAEH